MKGFVVTFTLLSTLAFTHISIYYMGKTQGMIDLEQIQQETKSKIIKTKQINLLEK